MTVYEDWTYTIYIHKEWQLINSGHTGKLPGVGGAIGWNCQEEEKRENCQVGAKRAKIAPFAP